MAASRPKVGIGVFVTSPDHPGCVLLGKRKGSTGSGTYAFPGGHLEFGEEWQDCAVRETMEETGLRITNVSFATVVNAIVQEEDYHYITIFMRGEVDLSLQKEPINTEPDKCEGWEWQEWMSECFPSPVFEPLRLARAQGYNPLEEKMHGHYKSDLFHTLGTGK